MKKTKKSFLVSKNNRFTWFIIGDTEAEIIAAKESKIPCISVTWGMRSEKFLLDLHPEYIANNVQELLSIIKMNIIYRSNLKLRLKRISKGGIVNERNHPCWW